MGIAKIDKELAKIVITTDSEINVYFFMGDILMVALRSFQAYITQILIFTDLIF